MLSKVLYFFINICKSVILFSIIVSEDGAHIHFHRLAELFSIIVCDDGTHIHFHRLAEYPSVHLASNFVLVGGYGPKTRVGWPR